ncbi:MAG TPA: ketoacyl-ACP synthase III [Kofleriaceae bacterium]|nr:ketoacyl-ACP synthase III [Kofleriaceae bacterium]
MNLKFKNKRISGIITVLAADERRFDDEFPNYGLTPKDAARYKKTMGLGNHRIARAETAASDMSVFGLDYLFQNELLRKDEVDGLIFISQTPDYFMPPTSNVIQGRLGLGHDTFCIDINQGCAGFVIGLIQAFMMLEQESIRKVVLVTIDLGSRLIHPRNRASYPLVGDGGSITIVENSSDANQIFANLQMDGSRGDALIVPAGGFRLPSSAETKVLEETADGVVRSKEHLHMDGPAVFNFTMNEVPEMITRLLATSQTTQEQVDYFMFHQPNRFILERIASKMKIPVAKMPNEIVTNFGNLSSASIPAAINYYLGDQLLTSHFKVCLAGFGVGLTWASMMLEMGGLTFSRMIDFA